jgi:phasin
MCYICFDLPRTARTAVARANAPGSTTWRRIRVPQGSHARIIAMSEVSTTSTTVGAPSRPKTRAASGEAREPAKFEIPHFEFPKFEVPKFEVPSAFREFAEKGAAQAKDNWEKLRTASEEATGLMEESYACASKGCTDYGLKLIEIARANSNAAFDFASELLTAKSLSQAVELSAAHARKQFDALTEQTKELGTLAQKVASETVEPIRKGLTSAFKKAA